MHVCVGHVVSYDAAVGFGPCPVLRTEEKGGGKLGVSLTKQILSMIDKWTVSA